MRSSRTRFQLVLVGCCTLVLGLWLGAVLAKSQAPQRPPLSQDKLATFLAGKRNAILATIKKDGSPQLTPVWYRWDGEQFWVSITKERAKYKNLLRDPRVSVCVDDAEHFTTVIASGTARLTEDNLWTDTQKIVERYRGPEQGAAYVQSMQEKKEPRVLLILKPERMISWGS
jgi:PPOX class probable F420-dependent enzyme